VKCPICGTPLVEAGEGSLDQCCLTCLPARVYRCPECTDTEVTLPASDTWRAYPAALEAAKEP
jgi:hypothetical protein